MTDQKKAYDAGSRARRFALGFNKKRRGQVHDLRVCV